MAILRASDLREKDDAELESDLGELRKTLMKIRGGLASGGIPEDVGKVREIKKTIARIMTVRHERKLGLKRGQPKPVPKEREAKAEVKPEETAESQKPSKKITKKTKKTREVTKKK